MTSYGEVADELSVARASAGRNLFACELVSGPMADTGRGPQAASGDDVRCRRGKQDTTKRLIAYLDECARKGGKLRAGTFLPWNANPEDLHTWAQPSK